MGLNCRNQPSKLSHMTSPGINTPADLCASMKKLSPYLSFNGQCREAMEFYRDCLGGELHLQTVGDSPRSSSMPAHMKETIVHALLRIRDIEIMGSDMAGENGIQKGNSISIMLDCSSEKQLHDYYQQLSDGGEATHPIHLSFWGALFGDLVDKYGNHWLLHFDNRQTN